MRVPSTNPRTHRAQKAARKLDESFFRENPHRCFARRDSLPFEQPRWQVGDHLRSPVTLVIRPNVGTMKHVTLAMAGDIRNIPDDERFLALLWGQIQFAADDEGNRRITADVHRELLRLTGYVPHGELA